MLPASVLPVVREQTPYSIEFLTRDGYDLSLQERGNHLLGRSVKKCFYDMTESRAARNFNGQSGNVDILQTVEFVPEVAFLLKNA